LEAWVASEGVISKASFDSFLMRLAIAKQLTGNILDQFIMTPMKDKAISVLQSTGVFDGGWKTSAEDNFEKYNQSVVHLGPGIKFMKDWANKLTFAQGINYVNSLKTGGGAGLANQKFSNLLGNHDFASRTRGGVTGVLEILCDDPHDHRALWFQGTKIRLESRLLDGRNRLATARGAEPLADPDKAIAMADLQLGILGPVDETTDVFFEIPSLVKNFFGQQLGDFASQDDYLKKLLDIRLVLNRTIDDLATPAFNYQPERLASKSVIAYLDHVYLERRYVDYVEALLKIKTADWERTRIYLSEASKSGDNHFENASRLSPGDQVALAAAQQSEEKELLELNDRLAYLKLEYFAYTGNYKAAASQVVEWATLANQLRKKNGESGTYNVRDVELEFKAKATAMETVAIYEGLLNEAILTIVTNGITTKVQERLLGSSERLGLWESIKKNQSVIATKLMQTAFPAHTLFSVEGIVGMAEGTAWTLVKEKIAFETAQMANSLSGNANAWDQSDFQAVVDNVFDSSKDILQAAYPVAREAVMERSAAWYAFEAEADMKLKAATEARNRLNDAMTRALADTEDRLTTLNWASMSKEDREAALNTVDDRLKGPLADIGVQRAMAQLSSAHEELDAILQKKNERIDKLKRYAGYLRILEEIEDRASKRLDAGMAQIEAEQTRNPAYMAAKAEAWKKIVFNKHSLGDLESLMEVDNPASLRKQLLTPNCDINVLRQAFEVSIKQAEADNNPSQVEHIRAIAAEVDDIRIDTINGILDEFLTESGYGREVALVIQGGAAKGNPEYQGLFADIDFTLMVHENSNVDQGKLKQDMLEYFAAKGFVLASKDSESSMDSEGFVQKLGKFDSRTATKKDIVEDLIEKGVDPTRFYTEGGTVWFINNAAYSGKLLWPKTGQGVKWVNLSKDFGHDLAVDMTRYLGFLTSPKYTEDYLKDKPEDYQVEALEAALGKTKYFIRLVDAYEIGHDQGNQIYNTRIERKQDTGEDTSYH
ncbi:MAG: hypothetical protein KJT03_12605, partial [Verrucomicrobiae bacterium]|nr:hypothetical protein [Verrucomicrobiae bacterium]